MITPIPNQMISTVIPEVPSVNVDVRDGEVEKNPLRVTTGKQKPEANGELREAGEGYHG